MKPGRWACSRRWAAWLSLLCAALLPAPAAAVAVDPGRALVLVAPDDQPPPDDDPRWQAAALPDTVRAGVAWYRVEFARVPAREGEMWMLYLPYMYGGGRIWLNGEPVAAVLEGNAERRVRWERPLLLPLPQSRLHEGRNVLHLRPVSAHLPGGNGLARIVVGTQDALQPQFERRLFFVRTVPLVTVVGGSVVGLLFIFIWLRRRQEVLYGLFGLAVLLWALRTTTFIFDSMPHALWPLWRLLYHGSTGGFIVVMTLFALAMAGWYRRGIAIALFAYWLLGPMGFVLAGAQGEELVGRWWAGGLIPIGLGMVVITAAAAWRRRSAGTVAIALAVALAVAAGVHDYLVAWTSPLMTALLPNWSAHRFFLLHHAANLLLLVMGALLTMRFVRSLEQVEEVNRTLEARVAAREAEVAASYQRIAALQREQATTDERQRIMRELHDGLGSQLFTSLLRAERGALDSAATVEMLQRAIDEMRIAIEALASDEKDFRTAFGNFRFRWDQRLRDAGVVPHWQVAVPDAVLAVPPHDALQLLRIVQEALTNVLKHARATQVQVSLRHGAGQLELQVQDDGVGRAAPPSAGGRGLAGMRARAAKLGAKLDLRQDEHGMRVALALPLVGAEAAASPEAAPTPSATPAAARA
ncbi:MAG TPA: ATP-binding protein [Rubrivivax sp.]|nr:ATP-binding protein [Rubrivivax sp.]